MNCALLKSVNINSLIQIGYYVLEEPSVHHKETNEYISRLVAALLNSAVDENEEMKVMQENFLLAVWCRRGETILQRINESASVIFNEMHLYLIIWRFIVGSKVVSLTHQLHFTPHKHNFF
jgi:hypothetical protein